MSDFLTRAQRSVLMSKIRGRNTKPEIALRKALWKRGLRYRLKSQLIGNPDIIFASYRAVIFVDGCFWHGCRYHMTMPSTNATFWRKKIQTNKLRDRKVSQKLRNDGWNVVRIWEHEIQNDLDKAAETAYEKITGVRG